MSNLKDLLKEVNNAVISSSPQPVIDLIEDFKGTNMDREKTEKLSVGLLNLFKSIQDHSQKLDTYFKCFRALMPILGPDIIVSELWEPVLLPILHSPFQPKFIVEEVKGITRDILTNETERVITFRKGILEIYLKESSMVGKAAGQDQGVIGEQIHAFWYQNLNNILRSFGGVKTKDFFDLLNSYFIQQQYRLQVLSLLTEFVRSQNLYIHQILETPLLDSLFKSLQRDTSTTIISLSLTALIMLLPHICISVVSYLPLLSLLTEFVRSQNLYIHQILETPLLDSLFKSLQRDTSTTIISLSLTALIMLLPHICISVVSYLPRLYTVFIRVLLWDKHNFGSMNFEGDDYELIDNVMIFPEVPKVHDLPKINILNDEDSWEQCDSSFDNVPSTPPNCLHLFTILYGMFPCNTIKFLRDPTTWLKERNFPSSYEGIGDDTIRSRSVPLLRRHTLHPNLILSDSQKELSDTSRWMKVESADVVAECVGFDIENALSSSSISISKFKPPPSLSSNNDNNDDEFTEKELKELKELEDTTTWIITEKGLRNSQEIKDLEDTTTTTEKIRRTSQSISMQEIVNVHQALKSGVDIVVGDDPWVSKIISYSNAPYSSSPSSLSPSLLQPPSPSLPPSSLSQNSPLLQKTQKPLLSQQASIAFLQREIMLLRNELNFELYLKQQYLQHIGRLHRDHILDSRVEAERQNLYITYRNLRVQLDKTKEDFNRQKDEAASIKKKHIKWEDELKVKLKKYRNEANERKSEIDKLEQELREAKLTISIQAKQIEESNAKNFKLESEIKVNEPQIQKLNEYKNQVNQLTKQLVIWESDSRKFQEQKLLMETLVSQWHKMELKLESSEVEIKSLKSLVSSQSCIIDDLKIKLEPFSTETTNALTKQMNIWTFERDKRDKAFKKLEIQYEKVKKRNEELEWRNMELLAGAESR
ncbi:hypothetical protein Glove_406g31 [Diversispora epigaea]|uniref:Tuberous sclerosis 1 n=1 Tax=Diversispora epigaea TaxID=1348612 RepID=A0A397GYM8_9GLOM|nr:hypothetical protein Glove_406g31 [Diversispora epigaea]